MTKLKWKFIIKAEIKDPKAVLEMDTVIFLQWLQAYEDFGEKGGGENG